MDIIAFGLLGLWVAFIGTAPMWLPEYLKWIKSTNQPTETKINDSYGEV